MELSHFRCTHLWVVVAFLFVFFFNLIFFIIVLFLCQFKCFLSHDRSTSQNSGSYKKQIEFAANKLNRKLEEIVVSAGSIAESKENSTNDANLHFNAFHPFVRQFHFIRLRKKKPCTTNIQN